VIEGGHTLTQSTSKRELAATLREINFKASDLARVWFRSSSGEIHRGKFENNVLREIQTLIDEEKW